MSFTPHPVIEFDPEARAFYFRLGGSDAPAARSVPLSDSVSVDYDEWDEVMGIEVLW